MLAVALTLTLAPVLVRPAAAQQQTVLHVAVRGSVDDHAVRLVQRAVRSLDRERAVAVVIEIDAAGGAPQAVEYLQAILEHAGVSVYAFVDSVATGEAVGVLNAADSVFAVPGSRIEGGPEGASIAVADTVADVDALLDRVALAGAHLVRVDRRWLGITIEVDNRNWRDVRVFMGRGRQRFSLGMVTSMRSATFALGEERFTAGSRIRLIADVIGSTDQVATDEVTAEPGLVIQWNIENVLSQSNYFVWVR